MGDFLNIPSDLRQQYMPFTIEGPGKRQLFSFKRSRVNKVSSAVAVINPFSRYVEDLFNNDSSIQYTHGETPGEKLKFENFLDLIPAIQIREYVPDAKLTQTFKWFSYLKRGFEAALNNQDFKRFDGRNVSNIFNGVRKELSDLMEKLTSGDTPLLKDVVTGKMLSYYLDKGFNLGKDDGYAVLFLPFILYYRLTTTHTNNIYELPYSMNNDLMRSDGTYGWTGAQSDFGIVDKLIGAGGSDQAQNSFVKALLGNTIKVNLMPSFQPSGETHGDTITINIDLINDSAQAAVANFLFCHTLFGNNKWLQYGFVQAGSSVYDIKLPGANRYFMCTGSFVCKGKGVFRTPNEDICDNIVAHIHPKNTFGAKYNSGLREELITSTAASNIRTETKIERDPSVKQKQYQLMGYQAALTTEASSNTGIFAPSVDRFFGFSKFIKPKKTEKTKEEIKNEIKQANEEISWDKAAYDKADATFKEAQSNVDTFPGYDPFDPTTPEGFPKIDYNSVPQDFVESLPGFNPGMTEDQVKELIDDEFKSRSKEAAEAKSVAEDAEQKLKASEEKYKDYIEAYKEAEETFSKADSFYSTDGGDQAGYVVTSDNIKDLIKIPDVYSLTLTFTSLIPDNFNNFLFGFRAGNLDPIENYANGTVDETGVMEDLAQSLEKALGG